MGAESTAAPWPATQKQRNKDSDRLSVWLNEAKIVHAWMSGASADDLEANCQAVMDRGRTQA